MQIPCCTQFTQTAIRGYLAGLGMRNYNSPGPGADHPASAGPAGCDRQPVTSQEITFCSIVFRYEIRKRQSSGQHPAGCRPELSSTELSDINRTSGIGRVAFPAAGVKRWRLPVLSGRTVLSGGGMVNDRGKVTHGGTGWRKIGGRGFAACRLCGFFHFSGGTACHCRRGTVACRRSRPEWLLRDSGPTQTDSAQGARGTDRLAVSVACPTVGGDGGREQPARQIPAQLAAGRNFRQAVALR